MPPPRRIRKDVTFQPACAHARSAARGLRDAERRVEDPSASDGAQPEGVRVVWLQLPCASSVVPSFLGAPLAIQLSGVNLLCCPTTVAALERVHSLEPQRSNWNG